MENKKPDPSPGIRNWEGLEATKPEKPKESKKSRKNPEKISQNSQISQLGNTLTALCKSSALLTEAELRDQEADYPGRVPFPVEIQVLILDSSAKPEAFAKNREILARFFPLEWRTTALLAGPHLPQRNRKLPQRRIRELVQNLNPRKLANVLCLGPQNAILLAAALREIRTSRDFTPQKSVQATSLAALRGVVFHTDPVRARNASQDLRRLQEPSQENSRTSQVLFSSVPQSTESPLESLHSLSVLVCGVPCQILESGRQSEAEGLLCDLRKMIPEMIPKIIPKLENPSQASG